MIEADFHVLLVAASFLATRFGQQYVKDSLPFQFRYHVSLNQSFDGHATPDEVLYPEDKGCEMTCLTERAAVAILYRDGRCPEWIDVNVEAVATSFTLIRLLCCGRFTDDRQKLYYERNGLGPFGIKSPFLPPDYREGSKFSLPGMSV